MPNTQIKCPHCGKQFEISAVTASEMGKLSANKMKRTKQDYAEMGRKGGKARNLSSKEASKLGKLGAKKRWGKAES